MEQPERIEIEIGGVGGQGVLLSSRMLVEAAGDIYPYKSCFPNYAGSIRGGQNDATVILSKKEIPSQILGRVTTAILMHPAIIGLWGGNLFEKYVNMVKPGGRLYLNSSLVTGEVTRDDYKVYRIPCLDLVSRKQAILTNMIMLGAYLGKEKLFPIENIEQLLEERMPGESRKGILRANKEALRKGADYISGL